MVEDDQVMDGNDFCALYVCKRTIPLAPITVILWENLPSADSPATP
jgi:hypothetical protein